MNSSNGNELTITAGLNFLEPPKQNKQETSVYTIYGILTGNLILVSNIIVLESSMNVYEIQPWTYHAPNK